MNARTHARVAGAGYLIIIIAGIFAEFFVRSRLVVAGDPAATARNILASESLYRAGMAGDLVMLLADVVVAVALFYIFKEVHRSLALLAAFLRLAQGAVLGANLLNLYIPLLLLGAPGSPAAFGDAQLQALASVFVTAHSYGYALGLVFFGLHCLVLGVLILRSRLVPRILGILLFLASLGYLTDSFGRTLMADYEAYAGTFQLVVFIPAFVGELALALWLLIKGVAAPASPRTQP